MKQPKTLTLRQFAQQQGNQTRAATALGVSFVTFNRWVRGHAKPTKTHEQKMRELGVHA